MFAQNHKNKVQIKNLLKFIEETVQSPFSGQSTTSYSLILLHQREQSEPKFNCGAYPGTLIWSVSTLCSIHSQQHHRTHGCYAASKQTACKVGKKVMIK